MVLSELIERLAAADQDMVVPIGFWHPHSYRGYYHELAFEPHRHAKVSDMLADAKAALGATYTGWKGGEFTMSSYTECHLAYEGQCGEGIGPVLMKYMLGELS